MLVGFPYIEYQVCKGEDCIWVNSSKYDFYMKAGYEPTGLDRMQYALPHWLPQDGKPVVLNLDDSTRASAALMQATMQITLKQEYMSWKLPEGSTVVLTSNPSNDADYDVTELDAAQRDRFIEMEVTWDKEEWCRYMDGKIPGEIINWVFMNPEVIIKDGKLVNSPRAVETFANAIAHINDYLNPSNIGYIVNTGKGVFDKDGVTVQSFIQFLNDRLFELPDMSTILEDEKLEEKVKKVVYQKDGTFRHDIATVLGFRLSSYLIRYNDKPNKQVIDTVSKFILSNTLGKENGYQIVDAIVKHTNNKWTKIFQVSGMMDYVVKL